jgi:hypothetical protein
MRIKGWSKLDSACLWETWLQEFATQTEAEATAIWIANRLVKNAALSTRRRFYEVKDIFLNRYKCCLVEGRIVREEVKKCNKCNGSGWDDWRQDECRRCDDGIYQKRFLYVHYLVIEGTRYSFHSYEKPKRVIELQGEDKESYGGKFTDEEIKNLKLPCSGLVRMLRYAAFAEWGKTTTVGGVGVVEFKCHCEAWQGRRTGRHHDLCRVKDSGYSKLASQPEGNC